MKIVQFYDNKKPPKRFTECMDTVKAAAELAAIPYELHNELPAGVASWGNPANVSDIFRFSWLVEHPEDIYLDADIKCSEIFKPEKTDKPYLCFNPGKKRPHADVWAIHGHGCAEFFKNLLAYINRCGKNLQVGQNAYSFVNFLIPRDSYYFIPAGIYEHKNFGTWIKSKKPIEKKQ